MKKKYFDPLRDTEKNYLIVSSQFEEHFKSNHLNTVLERVRARYLKEERPIQAFQVEGSYRKLAIDYNPPRPGL